MAIAVVNKKQTANTASPTLAITSATAGSTLVVAITTISTASAPTGKDNISGSTGWSTETPKSEGAANVITWVMTKTAVGGETELNPTVGAGGTIEGISYFELSGASKTIDSSVASKGASAKTGTSGKLTTTDAGDIVLGWLSDSTSPTGTLTAWTGTNPLANTETTSTRCAGGNLIPAKTLSEETFTANWETAKAWQMLVVAVKPAAGGESFSGSLLGKLAITSLIQGAKSAAASIAGRIAATSTFTGLKVAHGEILEPGFILPFELPFTLGHAARIALTGSITGTKTAVGQVTGRAAVTGTLKGAKSSLATITGRVALTGTPAGRKLATGTITGRVAIVGLIVTGETKPAQPCLMNLTARPTINMTLTANPRTTMTLTVRPAVSMNLEAT